MPRYSIIIPVYNAGKHLSKCLKSILSQTYTDFELVIINDGSTDNSFEICKDFARLDKRIRIINKNNGGASSARNTGIESATGKWITFVDADDYLENCYLEVLDRACNEEGTLVMQGLKYIRDNREVARIEFKCSTLIGKDIERAFGEYEIFKYGYSVGKLYCRHIVREHNISFNESISYSEDLLFMLEYLLYCDAIKFIGDANYCYNVDASTLSQKYNIFESEYQLYNSYTELTNKISCRFSFKTTDNSLRCSGLLLMRSIYSLYINKYERGARIKRVKQIRKEHRDFIKEYYKPQIMLFRIIKKAFIIHHVLFDIICSIKFR